MKRTFLGLIGLCLASASFAQKPVVYTKFTADPAPMVYNDTVFLYTTHDEDDAENFKMQDWLLYTSTDMVNFEDRGAVASLKDFKWYKNNNGAWAEQVIERDGKFYMYCPIHGNGISVLVADSPYGPFKDPLGKPLVWQREHWYDIDPTVFIDDDGQAYMYWGNPNLYMVKLNKDMISYSGEIVQLDKIKDYQEGPWFYKHNNKYYMAFASTCCPEGIGYAMSDKATGPWEYKGDIMPHTHKSRGNHPGIIDYKGNSYIFGLNYLLWADIQKRQNQEYQHAERRNCSVNLMKYNEDGTIQVVDFWDKNPVKQLENFNPFRKVNATTMAYGRDVKSLKNNDLNQIVLKVNNKSIIKIAGVDLKEGANKIEAIVKNVKKNSSIEIFAGNPGENLIGKLEFNKDGNYSCQLTNNEGVSDIWMKFSGEFEFASWQMFMGKTENNSKDFFSATTNLRDRKYPMVDYNGNAIFQVVANNAKEVLVDIGGKKTPMIENDNGIWTAKVSNLQRGINYYFIEVDGMRVSDPNSETFYGCSASSSCLEVPYNKDEDRFYIKDVKHGQTVMQRYYSKVDNCWKRFFVYLPYSYNFEKKKTYPVMYLQHGGGEDERGWTFQGNTDIIMDNLIAEHKAEEMLIVMSDGNGKNNFNNDIILEVIPIVEQTFRVKKSPEYRAMAGLSMGGIQTLNIAVDNPEYFNYYGVFSSGWWATPSPFLPIDNETYYQKLKEKANYYNNQFKVFWLSMGGKEDIAYYNCQTMLKRFDECGIKYQYFETPGGHTWPVWRESLYQFAQLIFKK